jgi:hypothetical protein
MRSRGAEVAALRKYERLRAKVEVLSRLTNIDLVANTDSELAQRQSKLVARELNAVLDELEKEEQAAAGERRQFSVCDIFRPLRIGPSYGAAAVLTKVIYYISAFVLLWCVLIGVLVVMVGGEKTGYTDKATGKWVEKHELGTYDEDTGGWEPYEPGTVAVGLLCLLSPFFINAIFWYVVARVVHARVPMAEVISDLEPTTHSKPPPPAEGDKVTR